MKHMTEIKVLNTRKVAMTFIVWDGECRLLISQVIAQHPVWFKLHSKQHRNLCMYFNSELLPVKANFIACTLPSERAPHFYMGDKSFTASLNPARHNHVRRKGILVDSQVCPVAAASCQMNLSSTTGASSKCLTKSSMVLCCSFDPNFLYSPKWN